MTESNNTNANTIARLVELDAEIKATSAKIDRSNPLRDANADPAVIACRAMQAEMVEIAKAYAAAEGITLAEVHARCMAAKD